MKNLADLISENAKIKNELESMKSIYGNNCYEMAKENRLLMDKVERKEMHGLASD